MLQTTRTQPHLFDELPRSAVRRVLPRLQLSGRDLEQLFARCVTVLPNEHDFTSIDAHDPHGAAMLDDFPRRLMPVGRFDLVDAKRQDLTFEDLSRRQDAF